MQQMKPCCHVVAASELCTGHNVSLLQMQGPYHLLIYFVPDRKTGFQPQSECAFVGVLDSPMLLLGLLDLVAEGRRAHLTTASGL